MGAIPVDLDEVGCLDIGMIKRITGEPCDGILGMDFLQNYVVSMDFDNQTLTIGDRVPEDATRCATTVPLTRMAKNSVGIPAVLNKTLRLMLMIDSGDTASVSVNKGNWNNVANPKAKTQRHFRELSRTPQPKPSGLRLRLR